MEDVLRLAFTMIDSQLFPMPTWCAVGEELSFRDQQHARVLADLHRGVIEEQESVQEKLAVAAGMLDAAVELERLAKG